MLEGDKDWKKIEQDKRNRNTGWEWKQAKWL